MPVEISDKEFDDYLETVYEAWEEGRDTNSIAEFCKLSEAKVDYILTCYLEGKFDQMEEARWALKQWPDFQPSTYLDAASEIDR